MGEKRAIVKFHYECNNSCLFCHASCRDKGEKLEIAELEKKVVLAKELGIGQIVFSGGEPTIYGKLEEAAGVLQKYGMKGGFITNGRRFFYKDFAKRAVGAGFDYFYVSLHSHECKIHDSLTKSSGSWKQTVCGLKNLLELSPGADIMVNCVVTELNADGLLAIVRFISGLGIKKIKFSYPEMKGRFLKNREIAISMEKAGKAVCAAMAEGDKLEMEVFYDGLPHCLVGERFRNRESDLQSENILYMSEVSEKEFFRTDKSDRKKKPACRNCLLDARCPGWYAGYGFEPMPIQEGLCEGESYKDLREKKEGSFSDWEKKKMRNNPQIGKYLFHRESLDIPDSPFLDDFEDLLRKSRKFRHFLECSFKVQDKEMHAARFDVIYRGGDLGKSALSLALSFIDKIESRPGVIFDRSILDKVCEGMDFSKVSRVMTGIDLREIQGESRAKVWFIIKDYPEKLSQVLDIHGRSDRIMSLIFRPEMLFGIDLYFDGRTGIKFYAPFENEDIENPRTMKRIERLFPAKIAEMISKCKMFNVTFRDKERREHLHFTPKNRKQFITDLDNPIVSFLEKEIGKRDVKNGTISLFADEIEKNEIKNVNFYY